MRVFEFHLKLYAHASGESYERLRKRFASPQQEKAFNQRMRNLTSTLGWDQTTLCGLFVYCYQHNPLALTELKLYGNLDYIGRGVKSYKALLRELEDKINEKGLFHMIIASRPTGDVRYAQDAMSLDEVYEVYGRDQT